jgi:hypothetical protein
MAVDTQLILEVHRRITGADVHDVRGILNVYTMISGLVDDGLADEAFRKDLIEQCLRMYASGMSIKEARQRTGT